MSDIIKSPVISLNVYDVKVEKHPPVEVKARPFYALTYRKSGIAEFHMNEKTLTSTKDCITFTPKGHSYITSLKEATNIIAIHFDLLTDDAFDSPFILKNADSHIFKMFEMILKNYSAENPCNYECFSLFYNLLEEIEKKLFIDSENKVNPKILKAKTQIDKNFSDNNFNIEKLSDSLGLSPSYLRREFKKAYFVSPIAYLKQIRLKNAVSLLASDYYTIEDIAQKCGYGSACYFIQVFHKAKGLSPSKYKELYLNA